MLRRVMGREDVEINNGHSKRPRFESDFTSTTQVSSVHLGVK